MVYNIILSSIGFICRVLLTVRGQNFHSVASPRKWNGLRHDAAFPDFLFPFLSLSGNGGRSSHLAEPAKFPERHNGGNHESLRCINIYEVYL